MKSSKFRLSFGVALACAAVIFSLALSAQAQTVDFFAVFNGGNGWGPSTVIQATDGNFYGTTSSGAFGFGNVFRVTPAGEITSIYSFCSQPNCADGAVPKTAPVLGSDGNLYGVTYAGGSDLGNASGWGTLYRLTLDGQITILHTFCTSPCIDGANPIGITLASDGNFYGTTSEGGEFTWGTLFKISPTGEFTLLHAFCSLANCTDGRQPFSPPIQSSNGSFYGTACCGGSLQEAGVLYEMTLAGQYSVLHDFPCNDFFCPLGSVPESIVQDANGNLFGVDGPDNNGAAILEITAAHQYIVLHKFPPVGAESYAPTRLTLANDGNFYDCTSGIDGYATLFEMTPEGAYTTLFTGEDGYSPYGPLFQGTDGNLYGPAGNFNTGNHGVIYRLSNGLSPLVETVPVAGPVGQSVIILGSNLTGSTSVTFNDVKATFTVESDTYIKATVPPGASTGMVSVVTSSGRLNSNPQFVVTK